VIQRIHESKRDNRARRHAHPAVALSTGSADRTFTLTLRMWPKLKALLARNAPDTVWRLAFFSRTGVRSPCSVRARQFTLPWTSPGVSGRETLARLGELGFAGLARSPYGQYGGGTGLY